MVGPTLNAPKPPMIKFLCSYGGRILPRYPDGKLRYHGGHTRVLAVLRSIEFSELMTKLEELCGKPVTIRCQLPTEDLDALVTITSNEDLINLIEEYDRTPCLQSSSLKIRAFLSLPKQKSPPKLPLPTPLQSLSGSTASGSGSAGSGSRSRSVSPKSPSQSFPAQGMTGDGVTNRCVYTSAKPPLSYNKSGAKMPYYGYRNTNTNNRIYLVHNGNHWQ